MGVHRPSPLKKGRHWVGTVEEYDALLWKDPDTVYTIVGSLTPERAAARAIQEHYKEVGDGNDRVR